MKRILTLPALALATLIFWSISACVQDPILNPGPKDQGKDSVAIGSLTDTVMYNVSYGNDPKQVYDIYLPANRDSTTPVLLMIHGGAWKAGQKEELNGYVSAIRTKWQEVAIVNMNYRLASNTAHIHHQEMMDDINAAVSHVLSLKMFFHISSNLGIMGASAGAQLAMIYAYKYNHNIKCVCDFFGPTVINDWSWYNSYNLWLGSNIGDILTEYVGQTWDTTAYKAVSPYWNVTSLSQPTIIFHGNLDVIVPLYQSQWMHGKLINLGIPNEYHEYIDGHGFNPTNTNDALNKMVVFFKAHI